jgi:hypothetical protein
MTDTDNTCQGWPWLDFGLFEEAITREYCNKSISLISFFFFFFFFEKVCLKGFFITLNKMKSYKLLMRLLD